MTLDKSPENIKKLFNKIAQKYDVLNNLMSLFLHKIVKTLGVSNLNLGGNEYILDCCTGTGDIAGIIKKKYPNTKVIGIDFSTEMLKIAQKKFPKVGFINGDCCGLPFDNEVFDCVTIAFGLRNIENYHLALCEIKRVLKIGGKILYIDFDKSKFPNKILDLIISFITKILKINPLEYNYLKESKNNFLTIKEISETLREAGFEIKSQCACIGGVIPIIVATLRQK